MIRHAYSLSLALVLLFVTLASDAQGTDTIQLSAGEHRIAQLDQSNYQLNGPARLTLTHEQLPIVKGSIDLQHDDAVILFKHIKPSDVHANLLKFVTIRGQAAVVDQNVRLSPYVHGTILLPHGPDYQPLTTFNQDGFKGDPRTYQQHTYYKSEQLATDEDQVVSFVLKFGYMATLAENEDGTGASQVFIANEHDLKLAQLPDHLRGKVSFIRVFPWRWTGKKGYCGSEADSQKLSAQWRYQWNAKGASTLDMDYVPMKHNANWPSYDQINSLTQVTHVLGFNEPMKENQANMTMEQTLRLWPKLQASGLRLGSPCPTDGSKAIDWVVEFVKQADERGYRVDFVTVHYYKGNWTEKKLIAWLRDIHERTGRRPLWVTEFNNGARWVKGHNPSWQENAENIALLCRAMDRCPFVERYAVFNMKDGNRRIIAEDGSLSPAGLRYRDNDSAQAYRGR